MVGVSFPSCALSPGEPQKTHWKRVCIEAARPSKFLTGLVIFDIPQTRCNLLAQDSLQFNINHSTFLLVMLPFVKLSFWPLTSRTHKNVRGVGSEHGMVQPDSQVSKGVQCPAAAHTP